MGSGDGCKDENGRLFHGGYWRTEKEWPLKRTRYTKYYFGENNRLNLEFPEGYSISKSYTHDPKNPVPTIGGSTVDALPLYAGGAYDQREKEYTGDPFTGFYGSEAPYLPLKSRSDILVFQTDPLKNDVEVTGPVKLVLYASSNVVDTDFLVKLIDVYPPNQDFPSGFEMNITDGIIRTRFRHSSEKPELMKPGKIYRFEIEPFPTANIFKKGHRIRIDISSSSFPRFEINPGTGESFERNQKMISADNTVYMDCKYPSHVILPVIPE
jgi:predicted acyl esterase